MLTCMHVDAYAIWFCRRGHMFEPSHSHHTSHTHTHTHNTPLLWSCCLRSTGVVSKQRHWTAPTGTGAATSGSPQAALDPSSQTPWRDRGRGGDSYLTTVVSHLVMHFKFHGSTGKHLHIKRDNGGWAAGERVTESERDYEPQALMLFSINRSTGIPCIKCSASNASISAGCMIRTTTYIWHSNR